MSKYTNKDDLKTLCIITGANSNHFRFIVKFCALRSKIRKPQQINNFQPWFHSIRTRPPVRNKKTPSKFKH